MFEIYYDRSSRTWHAYRVDSNGNQLGEAVHAHNRDMALIYLGMVWYQ